MESEIHIAEGLKSGDEEAYAYLYNHYYKILCIIANEYVRDVVSAEMIVSDVVFAIWTNRETFQIKISLRSYLVKAVKNRCINYLIQQSKKVSLERETNPFEYQTLLDDTAYPLTQLIEKELDIKINQSIEAMPCLTQQVFNLSRFHQMKYNEIANQLNISQDVVKYHIKSALVRLRKDLKDYLTLLILFLLE